MPEHHPAAIANAFIGMSPTHIESGKLHALVYLAQAWSLAINDQSLVGDEFHVTNVGPISIGISRAEVPGGDRSGTVTLVDAEGAPFEADTDAAEDRVIAGVWKQYGSWSRVSLIERLTEEGTPWHRAFSRAKPFIAQSDMRDHYLALMSAWAARGGRDSLRAFAGDEDTKPDHGPTPQ